MKKWIVSLSIALLASIATGAWLWSELRSERARNAGLAARLASSIVASPDPADAAPASAAAAKVSPAAPAATPLPAAPTTAAAIAAGSRGDWEAAQARLLRDPRFREARRVQQRLALAPRHANLVRLLGLTPAQADAVIDLQLDQEARVADVYKVDVNTDEARYDRRAKLEALDLSHQSELRALLGEDARAKLETYMESRPSRMQVDRFRADLTEANALRDDQVEPLIAALQVERNRMQDDLQDYSDTLTWSGDQGDSWRRYSERQAELWKAMNGRMHSSASSILTNAQLDALDDLLARDYARFEAQQRVNRLQSKLESASAATPAN
ncbi:MAG TPA: hypothetical protein VMF52_05690 [Steroidobacteraceae bacterium]|nr:hypothetical protein [Steroidobacteraceae bacterium]